MLTFLVVLAVIIGAIAVLDIIDSVTCFRFKWVSSLATWASLIVTLGLVVFLVLMAILEFLGRF